RIAIPASPLPALESNLHAFHETVAFALRLDLRVLGECEVHETALPRRERRQKLRPPGPANLVGRLAWKLLQGILAVRAETFGVESRVNGLAETFGGDAAHQDFQPGQSLALVGQQRLDVVSDELEEDLVSGGLSPPDLDQESRSREKLGQRRFARGDRVGVGRSRLQLSRR